MGAVKDAVQGGSTKGDNGGKKTGTFGERMRKKLVGWGGRKGVGDEAANMVQYVEALAEEVSRLTSIKDDDVDKEGSTKAAENMVRAGRLRAVHTLLTTAQVILEDYDAA